jgi:hypothetical protein
MDRDFAIRLEGMLLGARGHLDCITFFMRNNLPSDEAKLNVTKVAEAMAVLIEISNEIYAKYPDTIPKELVASSESDDEVE